MPAKLNPPTLKLVDSCSHLLPGMESRAGAGADGSAQVSGQIIFTGENPGITFMKPQTDERVAVVAFWRAMYSAHGAGNALLIWVADSAAPDGVIAPQAIYADNLPLARLVTDRFSVHFPRLQGLGFEEMVPQPARFSQQSDSRWYYRAACVTGDTLIELDWREVLDYQMLKQENLVHGGSRWDLSAVMCPCGEASIAINGQQVTGEVQSSISGDRPASSTFIALSETWLERTA